MIKAVLFDLDGVLVDACEWHYHALNDALMTVCEYEIPRELHTSTFNGLTTKTKLNMLTEMGEIDAECCEEIAYLKQENTKKWISNNLKFDAAKTSLISNIGIRGIQVGCVTNCIRETGEFMLKGIGIFSYLDCFITNEDVDIPKPHPDGYWKAMTKLGVIPAETLIVEDSPKGVEAAKATGANVWVVKNAKEVTWENMEGFINCEH